MKKEKKQVVGTAVGKDSFTIGEPEPKGSIWQGTMTWTTDENMDPKERLIWDLRSASKMIHHHRVVLFWLLMASLVAHAIR